ncbi:MAG TPA: DUF2934 domain-containing protein [Dongiaceae bacterium]|nr:DUF2934 domain-containing protein [Dongiaceae bacterium]
MESAAASKTALAGLQEAIRRRAEQIYIESGRIAGRDVENWAQAEREVLGETEAPTRRTAIVVKVNGVQYVGEYRPEGADGYVPGEFEVGSPVAVRLEGDRMFVQRPSGRELETRIVKKIG